jgi:drug/metabolite transporter (DMT)-like permease
MNPQDEYEYAPTKSVVLTIAGFYILSGISQPLIMTLCKQAGLADPSAQLYMLFYYLGPAFLIFTLKSEKQASFPTNTMLWKATIIAVFDIAAQALNYTGASLAGPTIFAVVYSSVTVWAAVFSRVFLHRKMTKQQWLAVLCVFGGLAITATNSVHLGPDVTHGTALIFVGSAMHALTYVMSEAVMTVGTAQERLTIRQNAAIQGSVACVVIIVWQIVFTSSRYETLILEPARAAGTTLLTAFFIFGGFMLANLIHSVTFYHTLRFYPGGATSAGVMKGLQAVWVFVAAHVFYCGRIGGQEMCFTSSKFISLLTVVGGVTLFGFATEHVQEAPALASSLATASASAAGGSPSHSRRQQGYTRIENEYEVLTV